jgi:glycosyltransferase involved in cell wall biosynthesis
MRATAESVDVSVVVPTRDRPTLIAPAIESLLAQSTPPLEIIVADQSRDDATQRVVQALAAGDARVRHVATATVGLPANRNVGLAASRGDVVAYIDDDCVADDGWVGAMVRTFADPLVTAVYGRLLPFEHRARTGHDVGRKDSLVPTVFRTRVPPWHVGHGGNMAFRRADALAVGGFDPLLGAGAPLMSNEDGDIAYRLLASGRRIAYEPDALAYHRHWKDWPAQAAMERAYGIGAGAQFAKYVRCGDPYGVRLFGSWMWELGVRRVGAGLLKWRSRKVMYLGYCQLVYPWLGVAKSLFFRIDKATVTYRP